MAVPSRLIRYRNLVRLDFRYLYSKLLKILKIPTRQSETLVCFSEDRA